MLSYCVFLLLYSALVCAAPAKEEKPCTVHDEKGNFYDLRPLSASTDYTIKSPGGHDFHINVCKPLVKDVWSPKVDDPSKVGGVLRKDHGDMSIGESNTTITMYDGYPRLTLIHGSKCSKDAGDSATASAAIDFICDKSVYSAGTPHLRAQLPPDDENACAFFFEWKTHLACPTNESGAMGLFASILVTIVVLLMIYLVLGTLYNRFVLGLSGFDQVPQFSFDSALYHVQNGWESAKDWIQGQNYSYPLPASTAGAEGAGSATGLGGFVRGVSRSAANAAAEFGARAGERAGAAGLNPFSHQAQTQAQVNPASTTNTNNKTNLSRSAVAGLNPVSHQSQVMAAPPASMPAPLTGLPQPNVAQSQGAPNVPVPPPKDAPPKQQEFNIMDQDDEEEEDDDDDDDDEIESAEDVSDQSGSSKGSDDGGKGQGHSGNIQR